jgi:membrane protein required for colicin V production
MSKADITIAIIIMAGAYQGVKDGFILELISIFAILIGLLAGFSLMKWIMVNLEQKYHIDAHVLPYIAFATVFFIIVFSVNLLTKFISPKVDHEYLGKVDSAVGSVLGLIRSSFMLSIFLWIFHSMKMYLPDSWTESSWIFPIVQDFAPSITRTFGSIIPMFNDMF